MSDSNRSARLAKWPAKPSLCLGLHLTRERHSFLSFSASSYHRATIGQRGVLNIGVLIILGAGLLTLFAGYPIISWALRKDDGTKGAFNLGGTNASGQVPYIPVSPTFFQEKTKKRIVCAADLASSFLIRSGQKGLRTTMIDPQTPQDALEIMSADGSTKMKLVFSDEFNIDGRSFYPGDDPYWEAVDLHYVRSRASLRCMNDRW